MVILYVVAIKKLINIKIRFTSFLMFIEEVIGVCTFAYLFSHAYKAMENYDVYVNKYGEIQNNFTLLSIYFCISQFIIHILIGIYKSIKKRSRLIKKRKIKK